MPTRSRAAFVVALAAVWPALTGVSTAAAPDEDFFESKVRPLLVSRCYECHAAGKQQGSVRLDSRAAMVSKGEVGPVVVPGDADGSRLLQVLKFDDFDVQMPPEGKLPAEEIAVLTEWVRRGAPWPEAGDASPAAAPGGYDFAAAREGHWSFRPVEKPTPPAVEGAATPVDRFVLARLAGAGISPSPPADKRTLLRRVYFDLLGLPPSPEAVAAFEADASPDAYAKVVDRLLADPRYGQRWGRHWLDVARYADTKGYVFTDETRYPYSYTYRDYVVDAFNVDKPFDRFVTEQLAADKLGLPADAPELAALGFLTVGPRFRNNIHDIIDDRIDVTTRGLMGLSVGCARCHDHKYDPIPTADYYSLYGVFASTEEPAVEELPQVGTPRETPEYLAYQAELAKLQANRDAYVAETHAELTTELRAQAGEYLRSLVRGGDTATDGKPLRPEVKNAWRRHLDRHARPDDPLWGVWKRLATVPDARFADEAAKQLAKLRTASPFRDGFGAGVLDRVTAEPLKSVDDLARNYGALIAAAGRPDGDAVLTEVENRLRATDAPPAVTVDKVEPLFNRKERDHERRLRKAVDTLRASSPVAPPRAMTVRDKPQPSEPAVFVRGNPGRRGERVPRRFLEVLAGPDRKPFAADASGRLDLAEAIADPRNPLTARVFVNRVWMHHFGDGLVSTPSDFGVRSDPPSHPELLDWLAADFIDGGWSVKRLHRTILLSATYRQASLDRSRTEATIARVDPENRLLWRVSPRRLEFEAMRDAMLAAAGRLDPALGGKPVDVVKGNSPRRTVYAFIDRNDVPGVLRSFDFANPDVSTGQRPETTVPQQALFGLNAPFVADQAKALAARAAAAGDAAGRVRRLYAVALQREPSADELALATRFLSSAGPQALDRVAQVLLLTNEFQFVE